jgi:hypothetical protein
MCKFIEQIIVPLMTESRAIALGGGRGMLAAITVENLARSFSVDFQVPLRHAQHSLGHPLLSFRDLCLVSSTRGQPSILAFILNDSRAT